MATTTRFLLSPCGQFPAWAKPEDIANYPGWTDCSDMPPEKFQKLVAEKLAVRPYVVGLAM